MVAASERQRSARSDVATNGVVAYTLALAKTMVRTMNPQNHQWHQHQCEEHLLSLAVRDRVAGIYHDPSSLGPSVFCWVKLVSGSTILPSAHG